MTDMRQFLKGHLVRDRTLAQLSERYGLPDRLIGHPSALASTRLQEKPRASIFESYIAALFLSEGAVHSTEPVTGAVQEEVIEEAMKSSIPEAEETEEAEETGGTEDTEQTEEAGETEEAEQHLTSATQATTASARGPTDPEHGTGVAREDVDVQDRGTSVQATEVGPLAGEEETPEEKQSSFDRKRALERVEAWLRPLFTPLAHWALDGMRKEQARLIECPPPKVQDIKIPAEWVEEDALSSGMSGALNTWLQTKAGGMPAYYFDELEERHVENPHIKLWRVTCVAKGKDGIM